MKNLLKILFSSVVIFSSIVAASQTTLNRATSVSPGEQTPKLRTITEKMLFARQDAEYRLSTIPQTTSREITQQDPQNPVMLRKNLPRQSVQFVRRLSAGKKYSLSINPKTIASKSYSQMVTGNELSKGVAIFTDGNEAMIRITSSGGLSQLPGNTKSSAIQAIPIEPADITLESTQGKMNAGDGAMTISAKSSELKAIYPQMFDRTSAFRVAKTLGHGKLTLTVNKNLSTKANYVIQVFDKHSQLSLSAISDQNTPTIGQLVKVTPSLSLGRMTSLKSYWLDSNGQKSPTIASVKSGELHLTVPLLKHKPGELVELIIEADIENAGNSVKRDLKIPFALHNKTASIGSGIYISQSPTFVTFSVPVDVKQASRYEIRGLISGQNKIGKKADSVMTFSATYVDSGRADISTKIKKADLIAAGLRPPFVLREIQLLDQGQVSVLQTKTVNRFVFEIKKDRAPIRPRFTP